MGVNPVSLQIVGHEPSEESTSIGVDFRITLAEVEPSAEPFRVDRLIFAGGLCFYVPYGDGLFFGKSFERTESHLRVPSEL